MTDSTTNQAQQAPTRTSTEVLERPVRRTFTADYKKRILAEAEACTKPGELGRLLRREGLYSSHLTAWRKQQDEALHAVLGQSRGRKSVDNSALAAENARLQAENHRLQIRLTQAQTILEVQKKLSWLLGLETPLNGMAS